MVGGRNVRLQYSRSADVSRSAGVLPLQGPGASAAGAVVTTGGDERGMPRGAPAGGSAMAGGSGSYAHRMGSAGGAGGGGFPRGEEGGMPPSLGAPNRVLLISIANVMYPITVDVMDKILRPYGALQKVVIFEKERGLQALAEFRSIPEAEAALTGLQGREIYDKCCRLTIQYSKNESVTVRENSERQRDFTNPHLPSRPAGAPAVGGGAPASFMGGSSGGGGMYGATSGGSGGAYGMAGGRGFDHAGSSGGFDRFDRFAPGGSSGGAIIGSGGAGGAYGATGGGRGDFGGHGRGGPEYGSGRPGGEFREAGHGHGGPTSVVMVYNLPADGTWPGFNHEHVFNLFGCFGDVLRVRLMSKPENTGMVELANPTMASFSMDMLDRAPLRGKPLHVTASKHTSLVTQAPAGSAAAATMAVEVRDFTDSAHHRFRRGLPARPPNAPCSTVYFTNLPASTTDAALVTLLTTAGASAPTTVRFMSERAAGGDHAAPGAAPRRAGFVDFPSTEDAVAAIMLCNNMSVDGTFVRLSFASHATRTPTAGDARPSTSEIAPSAGGGGTSIDVDTTVA